MGGKGSRIVFEQGCGLRQSCARECLPFQEWNRRVATYMSDDACADARLRADRRVAINAACVWNVRLCQLHGRSASPIKSADLEATLRVQKRSGLPSLTGTIWLLGACGVVSRLKLFAPNTLAEALGRPRGKKQRRAIRLELVCAHRSRKVLGSHVLEDEPPYAGLP